MGYLALNIKKYGPPDLALELVEKPFEHRDGWVYPPEGIGLGVDIVEEVVDRYRTEKVLEGD